MSSGFLSSRAELMRFAVVFLRDRLDSLKDDIQVCRNGRAPFPALLYCFSVIDLLGALLSGEASPARGISERSRDYMRRYMGCTQDQAELMQDVFRHKIVHLAQPSPVIVDPLRGKIAWQCDFNPNPLHLILVNATGQWQTPWGYPVTYDHVFTISIAELVKGIRDSVFDRGKYFHDLASDSCLQDNFRKAARTIMNVP